MNGEQSTENNFEYDVAVSFAGEDRELVHQVVRGLQSADVKVFYDQDELATLWGEDLVDLLHLLYSKRAKYAILFISRHYVEKKWPSHERRSAQERALYQDSPYILPVRLDDVDLPGLPATIGYIDSRFTGVDGIVGAVLGKLSRSPGVTSPSFRGKVPVSPGEMSTLLTERPPGWEYFLYAGVIRQGIDALDSKYRDNLLEYTPRSHDHITQEETIQFFRQSTSTLQGIISSLTKVLSNRAQEAAFGQPGEPGDPDRIIHLGSRLVSVYEEFLDWAAGVRAVDIENDAARHVAEVIARFADMPIETLRAFISRYVDEVESVPDRLQSNEPLEITMTVAIELDEEIVREHSEALKAYEKSLRESR